jgi:hypothetical protein
MLHLCHYCPLTPGVGGEVVRGEVWLAGIPGARETRLTPSKETCRLNKETCRLIIYKLYIHTVTVIRLLGSCIVIAKYA